MAEIRIAFIGAGNVNFGGGEGPWDHASRLERMPGVRMVAVADVDEARAVRAIAARKRGPHGERWNDCRAFSDWRAMVDTATPDAVFIGLPPDQHGRSEGERAVEVACAQAGVHIFVEKPLAESDPDAVAEVAARLETARVLTAVGYNLRCSWGVRALREFVQQVTAESRPPASLCARYACAYPHINKTAFWDAGQGGGPIIEQATHFVDLSRHLVGEIDLDSIHVASINADHPLGQLGSMPTGDDAEPLDARVPADRRIPRATMATWRFDTGALGCLMHGVLMHGNSYETEIELWGDGWKAVLTDPYVHTRLWIRDREQIHQLTPADGLGDSYWNEDQLFLRAIRECSPSLIPCTYSDALRTFLATCRIALST